MNIKFYFINPKVIYDSVNLKYITLRLSILVPL